MLVGLVLLGMMLAALFLLTGCADSCKQRTGDGICVDKPHNA